MGRFYDKKIISVSEVSVDDHIISRQEPYQFLLTYLENMNACRLGYLPSSQIESARSFLGRSFQNEIMR